MSSKIQTTPIDPEVMSTKSVDTVQPGIRKGVYLSSIVAAIGGFLCGFDTGATSGVLTMIPFQERFFTEDNLQYLQGLLLAFFLMTAALGALFSGYICGKYSIYIYFRHK